MIEGKSRSSRLTMQEENLLLFEKTRASKKESRRVNYLGKSKEDPWNSGCSPPTSLTGRGNGKTKGERERETSMHMGK